MRHPTPLDSSPRIKKKNPPYISTEQQSWATPSSTPQSSTPGFPLWELTGRVPSTWCLPTLILFFAFDSWDSSTLPSTGSDHTPILISLRPPSPHSDKPRPRCQEFDWPNLTDKLKGWQVPPPPDASFPNQLDQWFPSALYTLTATIEATAPRARPSPRSKAWWTPLLTSHRNEFTKATRQGKKLQTPTPTP